MHAGPPAEDRSFRGFGADAVQVLRDLREHNDKAWYAANRDRLEAQVRAPMAALVDELAGPFGPGKLFRQYRDVRFSKDKRPYKEWVAATIGGDIHGGARYLQIGPDELFVAAGAYQFDRERLVRFRRAVDAGTSGEALVAIVADLAEAGYEIGGRTLTRGPRDVAATHPRIDLMKHTGVTFARRFAVAPWWSDGDEVVTRVATVFGDAEPLLGWLHDHLS